MSEESDGTRINVAVDLDASKPPEMSHAEVQSELDTAAAEQLGAILEPFGQAARILTSDVETEEGVRLN